MADKYDDALENFSLCRSVLEEHKDVAAQFSWMMIVLPVNIGQTLMRMYKPA